MRKFFATSPRIHILNAAFLALAACDDPSVASLDDRRDALDNDDMAGTYEGTVQGPGGSLSASGEAALTVDQAGDSISGDMLIAAQFTVGDETISLVFGSTYTGVAMREGYPNVVLHLANPVCGGTTEFGGQYSAEHSSLTLAGEYVHKEADGCSTVATLDLAVSVRKEGE